MFDDICYKNTFLKEVVVRIDFFSPIAELETSLPDRLSKVLSKSFQIAEPSESIGHELQFGSNGPQAKEFKLRQWNFFGKNREKQLSITPSCMFLSYKKYESYELIREEFANANEALISHFPNIKIGRFGLRYINNIELQELNKDPFKFEKYISSDLIAPVNFFEDKSNISRLFHVIEFKNENLATTFQYGFPNPDYPASIKKPYFVIDIDSYIQVAHDGNESLKYMDLAHENIQKLFESSITQELRNKMNGN